MTGISVGDRDLATEREAARRRIKARRIPALFAEIDPGRYGFTHLGLELLGVLERVVALADEMVKQLGRRIAAPPSAEGFAAPRQLAADEHLFVRLFACRVACVEGSEATAGMLESPVRVTNAFDLAATRGLLEAVGELEPNLGDTLLDDLLGYVEHHRQPGAGHLQVSSVRRLASCLHAYFLLMGNTVEVLAQDSELDHLRRPLMELPVEVLDRRFRGFEHRPVEPAEAASGLMEISVDDIVGNQDYLAACLRTARDVAGYHFDAGRNPKSINPVLFALGRPGCGKTITAHAVGNYFLDFCRQRSVPARFLCIKRTDWASSYQNASANALVRIFTEEVGGYHGVVGVYWADIDTAFAARSSPGIRSEERNILGAVFGIFDGTLLPHDGKWFMMCDANHMHMDEATISRITQDPYVIHGPRTDEEITRLLRDVELRRHVPFLDLADDEWLALAASCRELGLSGRSLANIARRVIAEIEDFDYPDEYYGADFARRREIIAGLSNTLCAARLAAIVERYGGFEREAEARAAEQRFESRVDEIMLNLSAQEEVISRRGRDDAPRGGGR